MNLPIPQGDYYFFEFMKYLDSIVDANKYVLVLSFPVLVWASRKTKNKWDDWAVKKLQKKLGVVPPPEENK